MVTRGVREGFAERLQLALDEAGYSSASLKQLGSLFGVSPQAVRKWLGGEAMPVSARAPAVAECLGVRRSWLLDNELPMRPVSAAMLEAGSHYRTVELSLSGQEFRLIRYFRQLPQSAQENLLKFVESVCPFHSDPAKNKDSG